MKKQIKVYRNQIGPTLTHLYILHKNNWLSCNNLKGLKGGLDPKTL